MSKIPVIFTAVILILFTGAALHAEDNKEKEMKITIEKTAVIGVLEKPAVIFPIRWKLPEGQPARTITPERSFKREILEFTDTETIRQEE